MEQKDNKLKLIKWGFIALIALIGLYKCDSIINAGKALIKPSNSFIDTVTIESHDTVWAKDTVYYPTPSKPSKPIVIHDTFYKPTPIDSLDINRFYFTLDTLKDNNIEIYDNIVTQGKTLKGHKPGYKLKVPLTIIDSKTVSITHIDTIYKQPKYSFSIGGSVGTQLLCPQANFTIDRHTFGFGYNLQTKTPTIHYNFRIWSSKKR